MATGFIVYSSSRRAHQVPRRFASHQLHAMRFMSTLAKSLLLTTSAVRSLTVIAKPSRVNKTVLSVAANNSIMSSASLSTQSFPTEMTEAERYLFDLNGFIVIRGVLTPEEVREANEVIDRHEHEMVERSDAALRNAVQGTKLYGSGPGRKDLGRVLEWGAESKVFKSILAHPRLVPLFHGILGKGYRMDHLPFVLCQDHGAEGFQLHGGTIDCETGEYNPNLAYSCFQGTIRSVLLGCNVMLADHNPGDGGFCVVPGSHKSNFKMPDGMRDGEMYSEYIIQPATKAGDVVLFSEGTVHGALAWTPENRQRRACLYRFAPATCSYGRSYMVEGESTWPNGIYEDLTDAQRAVLEPPYANRLDRPNIESNGSVKLTTRSERKRQHDRDVFGTKYF
jgi:hypothetical protein